MINHPRVQYLERPRTASVTPSAQQQVDFSTGLDLENEATQLVAFDREIGLKTDTVPNPAGVHKVFLRQQGPYKVYLVDDFRIRNISKALEEFSNFAIHADFPRLVPQNEIWISQNETPREREFYIASATRRLNLIAKGMNSGKSYDVALNLEKRMREQDDKIFKQPGYLSEHAEKNPQTPIVPANIYVRKLGEYKGYQVWIVDQEKVQDTYKTDWVDGGNNSVYHFIPPTELWLSNALDPEELKFVVWHEWVESWLMRNKGWAYDNAHRRASATEYELRRDFGL